MTTEASTPVPASPERLQLDGFRIGTMIMGERNNGLPCRDEPTGGSNS